MATTEQTAVDTLSMLEERLERINFAVNGHAGETSKAPGQISAAARLRNLDRTLKALAARSYAVADILQLHHHYPELFHPTNASAVPSTLLPASLAQLVLAHEDLYKSSKSQLSTLNDAKDIPDPTPLTKLIAMQPRIEKLEAKQKEHAKEFAELRARSAKVVERWYEGGVLNMGEKWAEWEEKLKDCEILVRRREAAKRREDGMV